MARLQFKNINGTLIGFNEHGINYLRGIREKQIVEMKVVETNVGSFAMVKTWRMWMKEIALHMSHKGCTMPLYIDPDGIPRGSQPFDGDDAHELFTKKWLGTDKNGIRYSWGMTSDGDHSVAPKSLRLHAMDHCVQWSAEQGIAITIPREGEYRDYAEGRLILDA